MIDLRSVGALWVVSLTPKGDKATRLSRETVPKAAAWLNDFERELVAFPNGKHDDQVDSVSQMLCTLDRWPGQLRGLSRYAGRPPHVPLMTAYAL